MFSFAELGFQETETSRYLTDILKENGFEIEYGISGVPTAWMARWGSGKPVIARGSDLDCIPKASQKPGVDALAAEIFTRSERAMRDAIAAGRGFTFDYGKFKRRQSSREVQRPRMRRRRLRRVGRELRRGLPSDWTSSSSRTGRPRRRHHRCPTRLVVADW